MGDEFVVDGQPLLFNALVNWVFKNWGGGLDAVQIKNNVCDWVKGKVGKIIDSFGEFN